jgi:hypothetical protein
MSALDVDAALAVGNRALPSSPSATTRDRYFEERVAREAFMLPNTLLVVQTTDQPVLVTIGMLTLMACGGAPSDAAATPSPPHAAAAQQEPPTQPDDPPAPAADAEHTAWCFSEGAAREHCLASEADCTSLRDAMLELLSRAGPTTALELGECHGVARTWCMDAIGNTRRTCFPAEQACNAHRQFETDSRRGASQQDVELPPCEPGPAPTFSDVWGS